MDPTRIIAIRHGETAWNVDTRIQGQLDIPLNENGRWQARRLAAALAGEEVAAVYTSDLSRAHETARFVAGALGHETVTHQGLRERAFGIFEGRTFKEIETTWPEDSERWRKRESGFAPEGGESLEQLHARVFATAGELAARHPGEQVVLVAHGGVLDILHRIATRQDLQAPRTWQLGNAAINRLLWTPEGFSLVGWSDTRHLENDSTLDEAAA
ncbi:MAG: histidine phosphatase family protein [Burkholderiaceae bacterium]